MIPLILIPIALLLLVKKKPMPKQNKYQIEKTLKEIKGIFGADITRNIEKIYRLETRNFSSKQFLKTYSAGMEAVTKKFPYGWKSLQKFWSEQKNHAPVGFVTMNDADTKDGADTFIKFPTLFSAMFALGLILQKRGNDIGSWYSTEEGKKEHYRNLTANIPTTITDKIA